jgi:hypothetical protein
MRDNAKENEREVIEIQKLIRTLNARVYALTSTQDLEDIESCIKRWIDSECTIIDPDQLMTLTYAETKKSGTLVIELYETYI